MIQQEITEVIRDRNPNNDDEDDFQPVVSTPGKRRRILPLKKRLGYNDKVFNIKYHLEFYISVF